MDTGHRGSNREQNRSNLLYSSSLRFEQRMSVHHCGFNALVPEQVLQHWHWNAAVAPISRKRVTEAVPAEPRNTEPVAYRPHLPAAQVAIVVRLSCFVRKEPLGALGADR